MKFISSHTENLCARLGLGPAVDPAWLRLDTNVAVLRLILMPSFHPSGVLTIYNLTTQPHCQVKFERQVRHRPTDKLTSCYDEQFPWPADTVPALVNAVLAAKAADQARGQPLYICLDGIRTACILCIHGRRIQLEVSFALLEFNDLQHTCMEIAAELASHPAIRTDLTHCLRYYRGDRDWATESRRHPAKPVLHLTVWGPDDDRKDLALALNARFRHRRRQGPSS